jgi:hypothetical protein
MKEEAKPVEESKPDNKPANKTSGNGVSRGIVSTLLAVALEFIWKNRNDIVDLIKRIFKKKTPEKEVPKPLPVKTIGNPTAPETTTL